MLQVVLILAVLCCAVDAFRAPLRPTAAVTKMQALPEIASILTAVAEAKPDGYQYGSVAAPDFVLPLGAVLVILTAAIPFLLKPGEEALEQQRIDEETVNNVFGDKNNGVSNKKGKKI